MLLVDYPVDDPRRVAVVVLTRQAVTDWITAVIAVATLALLLRFKKIPEPYVVAVAGVLGIVLY